MPPSRRPLARRASSLAVERPRLAAAAPAGPDRRATPAPRRPSTCVTWPFERVAWPLERPAPSGRSRSRPAIAIAACAVAAGRPARRRRPASPALAPWRPATGGAPERRSPRRRPPPAPTPAAAPKRRRADPAAAPHPTSSRAERQPPPPTGRRPAKPAPSRRPATSAATPTAATARPPRASTSSADGQVARPARPRSRSPASSPSAFVLYEIGEQPTRRSARPSARPRRPQLAKALLRRPPRLPADVKVPKAKVAQRRPRPRAAARLHGQRLAAAGRRHQRAAARDGTAEERRLARHRRARLMRRDRARSARLARGAAAAAAPGAADRRARPRRGDARDRARPARHRRRPRRAGPTPTPAPQPAAQAGRRRWRRRRAPAPPTPAPSGGVDAGADRRSSDAEAAEAKPTPKRGRRRAPSPAPPPPSRSPRCPPPAAPTSGVPPVLIPIYQRAAAAYGLGPQGPAILAGINEIETAFGTNLNVSSAGAVGWMQFMPSTWDELRRRRQRRRGRRPLQPRRRDLRRRQLPQRRRACRPTPTARSSPTTTPTGTSPRCSPTPAATRRGRRRRLGAFALDAAARRCSNCNPAQAWRKRIPRRLPATPSRTPPARYELGKRGVWALAAVARLESNFGRGMSKQQLRDRGPLGLDPSEWSRYAVDGDGDGRIRHADPADSAATLARLIWSRGGLRAGIFTHNQAEWYVQEVLARGRADRRQLQGQLRRLGAAPLARRRRSRAIDWSNLTLSNEPRAARPRTAARSTRAIVGLIGAITQHHHAHDLGPALRPLDATTDGNVSNHYYGRAMDIAVVDGVSCTDTAPTAPCGELGHHALPARRRPLDRRPS